MRWHSWWCTHRSEEVPDMPGPLVGLRVVELAGIGPAPHAAMLLADLGADVVRVERPAGGLQLAPTAQDQMLRGRRSISLDLKDPSDRETLLALAQRADVLIEGLRPGVTERLGIGPADCRARNPRLVYARMTGWGQHGPLADRAGHDINYIAVSGVLHALGLTDAGLPDRSDPANLPVLRQRFTDAFAGRSRDEWVAVFEGTDACVAPVLSFAEVDSQPHIAARGTIVTVGGVPQAAPAPRFSRTAPDLPTPPPPPGADTAAVLADWGIPSAVGGASRTTNPPSEGR